MSKEPRQVGNLLQLARQYAMGIYHPAKSTLTALKKEAMERYNRPELFAEPEGEKEKEKPDLTKCGGCKHVFIADEDKEECDRCERLFCEKCAKKQLDGWETSDEQDKQMTKLEKDDVDEDDDADTWSWMPDPEDVVCEECRTELTKKLEDTLANLDSEVKSSSLEQKEESDEEEEDTDQEEEK